jgi:hypothetical protein
MEAIHPPFQVQQNCHKVNLQFAQSVKSTLSHRSLATLTLPFMLQRISNRNNLKSDLMCLQNSFESVELFLTNLRCHSFLGNVGVVSCGIPRPKLTKLADHLVPDTREFDAGRFDDDDDPAPGLYGTQIR